MAEQMMVPAPVRVVADHFRDLNEAYERDRVGRNPDDALAASLHHVLRPEDATEVSAYFAGQYDDLYARDDPDASGIRFREAVLTRLEASYADTCMIRVATTEFKKIEQIADVVELAERLATNVQLIAWFRTAVDEKSDALATFYVNAAVLVVQNAAEKAQTKIGRQTKIDQAVKVLQIFRSKAARIPGDIRAESQALWCAAVIDALTT